MHGWAGGSSALFERDVAEQLAHGPQGGLLAVEGEVRDARLAGVSLGPAELLLRDLLVRHRPDDVGAGDEHVGGALHHEDEVGDGRAVHGAAGARAKDDRDLRHHAGGQRVAQEDIGIACERDDALLDPCPAGIVEPDDRAPDLHGEVHDLADLLGVSPGEGAAEHREVLCEDEDLATLDEPVAGDDPVAGDLLGLHAEVDAAVRLELVDLHEAAWVEEQLDALAGGELARLVLLRDAVLAPAPFGVVVDLVERGPARIGVGGLVHRGGEDIGAPSEVASRRPAVPRHPARAGGGP